MFAPKFRRKIIYNPIREDVGRILRELCDRKGVEIIEEYISNQLQEDLGYDQMTLKEYIDPFTGEPVNKGK